MKDILGQQINPGDFVIITNGDYAELQRAIVVRLNKKHPTVIYTGGSLYDGYSRSLHPSQMCVLDLPQMRTELINYLIEQMESGLKGRHDANNYTYDDKVYPKLEFLYSQRI